MKHLPTFLILLLVVLGCEKRPSDKIPKAQKAETPSATPTPYRLHADVSLSSKGVVITNTDSSAFGSLTVKLNMKNLGGNDGEANVSGPDVGKTVVIPYGEFLVGTERFSIRKTKILTVFIKTTNGTKLFLCPGARCQPA